MEAHTGDQANPTSQAAPRKPKKVPSGVCPDGGVGCEVPTFHHEGATSLAPLALGDLKEIRSSMAAEGFVIPEKRFNRLVEEVAARLGDGSVSDAIRQAQHWLVASVSGLPPTSEQDASGTPRGMAKKEATKNPEKELGVLPNPH